MTEKSRLSRWAERKSKAEKGESLPSDFPENTGDVLPSLDSGTIADDPDQALSDDELLAQHDLPDPAAIDDEDMLGKFLEADIPDRLRQLALRRLWRINPLFGIVDEMVEYGEDYTDAATVIEGMQSAYQVGKGYLKKTEETLEKISPSEEDIADSNPSEASDLNGKTEEEQFDQGDVSDQGNQVADSSSNLDDADETSAKESLDDKDSVVPATAMIRPDTNAMAENSQLDPQVSDALAEASETVSIRPRRQIFRKQ